MLRVLSLSLLLCLFAIGVASLEWGQSSSTHTTIPVFMWSPKQIFSSKSQVVDTLSNNDVESALAALFKTGATEGSKVASSFNDKREVPEVVVLFVEPELTTDMVPNLASAYATTPSGAFSNLKGAMEAAGSSLVMPYTKVDEVTLFDNVLANIFESTKGSIFISRLQGSQLFNQLNSEVGVKIVEIDSLLVELKSANVFSNGMTDLVVVCFDKPTPKAKVATFTSHDELIGSISASISTATKGNYVAMYSANTVAASNLVWTFEQPTDIGFYGLDSFYMLEENGTNNTNNTNTTTVIINYFPGALIEVYLIVAILIAMVFTGGCAIFSLQTPDRWEAPKVKREAY